jgi:hypothetical protein
MNHGQTQENTAIANRRTAILADLRATFGSGAGERTLAGLKRRVGYGRPCFLPASGGGPFDPYAAAYRDGRKSVLEEILADLASAEDAAAIEPRAVGGPDAR